MFDPVVAEVKEIEAGREGGGRESGEVVGGVVAVEGVVVELVEEMRFAGAWISCNPYGLLVLDE